MSELPLSTLLWWFDLRPPSTTFGTYVMPTRPIPFDKPKTPEELRDEAAARVLGVFRELGVREERKP